MSVFTELHRALYERLKNSLSVEVYDYVPDDAEFPFVNVGELNSVALSTKDEKSVDLYEVTSTIHVFSRYLGMKEVEDLSSEVIQAVLSRPLQLSSSYHCILVAHESTIHFREDAKTRHSIIKFKILVEEV
jgi:hypothetical protein